MILEAASCHPAMPSSSSLTKASFGSGPDQNRTKSSGEAVHQVRIAHAQSALDHLARLASTRDIAAGVGGQIAET